MGKTNLLDAIYYLSFCKSYSHIADSQIIRHDEGDTKWNNGITYLFIRGALMVEDMEAAADHIDFSAKATLT